MEEVSGSSRPNQCHRTFGYHRPVKDGATMLFRLHTARHKGRLRSVKSADGATSNGDKHHGENRTCLVLRAKSVPHFRQVGTLHIKHHQHAHRHKQQGEGKEGIDLADNLIHGHHGSEYVIQEDNDNPEISIHPVGRHSRNQLCGTAYEHCAHEYHQYHREDGHHLLGAHPQIAPYDFWQTLTAVSDRQGAREEIVHRPGKDSAEHNPEIRCRAKLRTHNCPKDRTKPCNVQELNHKDFPVRQGDIVHPVCHRRSRRWAVVRTKDAVHVGTVNPISENEHNEGNGKGYHSVRNFLV